MHVIPQNKFSNEIVQLILGYIPPYKFSGRSGVLNPDDLALVHSIINQVSPQSLCEYAFGQTQIKKIDNDICINLLKFCCDELEINEKLHVHEINLIMNKIVTLASILNIFKPHNVIQLKNIFQTFSHLSRYHSCLAQNYHSFLKYNASQDLASEFLQQNEFHKKFLSTDEQLRNRYAVVGKLLNNNINYEVRAYLERDSSIDTIFFITTENSVLRPYNEAGRRTPQFSAHITSRRDKKTLEIFAWCQGRQSTLNVDLVQVMMEVFRQNAMKILWVTGPSTNDVLSIINESQHREDWTAGGKSILTTTGGVIPELNVHDMDQEFDGVIFKGEWVDLSRAETGIFDHPIGLNPNKRVIEITHVDGSVRIFADAFFHQSSIPWLCRLFVRDHSGDDFSYLDRKSANFGALTIVHVYPKETQINAIIESTKYFFHQNIQNIIIEYF